MRRRGAPFFSTLPTPTPPPTRARNNQYAYHTTAARRITSSSFCRLAGGGGGGDDGCTYTPRLLVKKFSLTAVIGLFVCKRAPNAVFQWPGGRVGRARSHVTAVRVLRGGRRRLGFLTVTRAHTWNIIIVTKNNALVSSPIRIRRPPPSRRSRSVFVLFSGFPDCASQTPRVRRARRLLWQCFPTSTTRWLTVNIFRSVNNVFVKYNHTLLVSREIHYRIHLLYENACRVVIIVSES